MSKLPFKTNRIGEVLSRNMLQSAAAAKQAAESLARIKEQYPDHDIEIFQDEILLTPKVPLPTVDMEALSLSLRKNEDEMIARILEIDSLTVPAAPAEEVLSWFDSVQPKQGNWGGAKRDPKTLMQEFTEELREGNLTMMHLSYDQGIEALWGMADIGRHYYLVPPLRPCIVKTKKGPRRYRAQMVRRPYTADQCDNALGGMSGTVHQTTKLPGLK